MFIPLHVHDDMGSLLDGLSKGWQIAKRARQIGAKSVALTSHGSLAGIPKFMAACAEACKYCGNPKNQHDISGKLLTKSDVCPGYDKDPIKAINGNEFYLCNQDAKVKDSTNKNDHHLCVLAKNKEGWKNLIKASNYANMPEHFYRKPRLSLKELGSFANNSFVVFSGHPGSHISNLIFVDPKLAFRARTYEQAKALTKEWGQLKKELREAAGLYQELFGKENFFLEIQLIDAKNLPAAEIIVKCLRWLSKDMGIPCVATPDAHYPTRADAQDQRILLCSSVKLSLREAAQKLDDEEDFGLSGFFRSNNYHIPDREEMELLHEAEEIKNTERIAEMCEAYSIFAEPKIPQFKCPEGVTDYDYLRRLAHEGWKRKIEGVIPVEEQPKYKERMQEELGVLKDCGLIPYFLIVQDYCRYAVDTLKCMKQTGRGSAAGCLTGYLLDIHDTDSIKYGLSFARFFNKGRITPGKISLPDIDCDFPKKIREQVLDYIKGTYGSDRVSQIVTLGRMQGREALKSVFRAHEAAGQELANTIASFIPDESKIADELEQQRQEFGESSIISWALEHNAAKLKEWVEFDDNGELQGSMAKLFEQAIRLEGTKRNQSKHAAGVIIYPEPLAENCPMLYDKSNNVMIAGMEMGDLEKMGGVKFDILGLAAYDKIMACCDSIASGE